MYKLISIQVINILASSCFPVIAALGQNVSIQGVESNYRVQDTAQFEIKSKIAHPVFVTIGLEKFHNGKWYEVTDDAFRCSTCMHTATYELKPNDSAFIKWPTANLALHNVKKGKYRFVLFSGTSTSSLKKGDYSVLFIIR